MSRIALALLVAASLSMAPSLALGDEDEETSSRTSAAQSEGAQSCAARSEATPSGEARYCPARSETPAAQETPIFVPPNRGSPSTRIGGASRGGARPVHSI